MSTSMPPAEPNVKFGLGIAKSNAACVAFFAIAGLIFQFPVILTHCGLVGRPNVPVVILSLTYVYICLSYAISAISWSSSDITHWWSGRGWCDLDVRLFLAASLGVLSTQCVINWNMLEILGENAAMSAWTKTKRRWILEIAACLFLPFVNLAVSSFTMMSRFDVVQDVGCLANEDLSVAYIVTYLIWPPILGLGTLVTIFLIIYRFFKRGRAASIQSISFIPHMGYAQFVRICIFSLAVASILAPLSIALSVVNFISVGHDGVHQLAWLHGKPVGWDTIHYMLLDQIPIPIGSWGPRPTFVLAFITKYINLAIAWLLFLCYGTGSVARESYALIYRKLGGGTNKSAGNGIVEMVSLRTHDRTPTASTFKQGFNEKFDEWETGSINGANALRAWEEGASYEWAPRAGSSKSTASSSPGRDQVPSAGRVGTPSGQVATPKRFFTPVRLPVKSGVGSFLAGGHSSSFPRMSDSAFGAEP